MSQSSTEKLFAILETLSRSKIFHSLTLTRDNAVTILAVVPGERWEIDIWENGEVYLEVFKGDGRILEIDDLEARISKFAE